MTTTAPTLWRRLYHTRLRDVIRGRFNASLDWRLVLAEANLPTEINSVIEHVVRRTRLWRSEKVDVASELVAHFQDGLEAGQSPSELVKSFGDPQQTAQLIRRAKKRGRSLFCQLWRYGCWSLGAIVIAYLAAGLWMLMDRPSVTTDYLAIINERALAVPESEKAWPLYRDALLALNAKPLDDDSADPFNVAQSSKPGDANWPEAEKFLSDHAGPIAKLRDAGALHDLGFVAANSQAAFTAKDRKLFGVTVTPEDTEAFKHQTLQDRWLISTLLPHLNQLRSASLLLANDARRAASIGDGDTAMKDVAAIYGISRHCEEAPLLINVMIAEAAQQQARAAIRDVLRDHPDLWTNAQLRDLAHQVAAAQIDWRRGFIGERACFYDSMQRIYTDNGEGDGRLALHVAKDQNLFELLNSVMSDLTEAGAPSPTPLANGGLAMLAMPATNMVIASRKEMTDVYHRFVDSALEQLEKPLWETDKFPTMDEEFQALQRNPIDKFRYFFVSLLLPAHDTVRNRAVASHGERDGVLVGLALELYHREHGNWPASLEELSPRWLPELPVDQITGEPLKYHIADDRPVVYSLGSDSDDDGGKLPVECKGDAANYQVSSPSRWKYANASQEMQDDFGGDWVIWSTVQ